MVQDAKIDKTREVLTLCEAINILLSKDADFTSNKENLNHRDRTIDKLFSWIISLCP